jgi:hypothetical protein
VIIEGNAALSIHDHSEEEEEERCTSPTTLFG